MAARATHAGNAGQSQGSSKDATVTASKKRIEAAKGWQQVLQVQSSAVERDIRAAYHKLALLHHPDKTGGDDSTFKRVRQAYDEAIVACGNRKWGGAQSSASRLWKASGPRFQPQSAATKAAPKGRPAGKPGGGAKAKAKASSPKTKSSGLDAKRKRTPDKAAKPGESTSFPTKRAAPCSSRAGEPGMEDDNQFPKRQKDFRDKNEYQSFWGQPLPTPSSRFWTPSRPEGTDGNKADSGGMRAAAKAAQPRSSPPEGACRQQPPTSASAPPRPENVDGDQADPGRLRATAKAAPSRASPSDGACKEAPPTSATAAPSPEGVNGHSSAPSRGSTPQGARRQQSPTRAAAPPKHSHGAGAAVDEGDKDAESKIWEAATRTLVEQGSIGEAKQYLIEQLLSLPVAEGCMVNEPTTLPADGKFLGGVQQYCRAWSEVVVAELNAQVYSDIPREDMTDGALVEVKPYANLGFRLQLLTGTWVNTATGRPIQRIRVSIHSTDNGDLGIAVDGGAWCGILGPTETHGWRRACQSGLEYYVRLRNWNTIDLYCSDKSLGSQGIQMRRASRDELRAGTPVLLIARDRRFALGERVKFDDFQERCWGVVHGDNRSGIALVRAPADFGSQRAALGARILSVNMTSSARELAAVRGAADIPHQLLVPLLGTSSATAQPSTGRKGALRKKQVPTESGNFSLDNLPCVEKLNPSQLHAVEAACRTPDGFTLVWGPPGTGKSQTVLALLNALHLQEYERLHRAVEGIVLGTGRGTDTGQWRAAVQQAPRILVTASSNAAVEQLMERVCKHRFLDRRGNAYEPWGIVRVGVDRGHNQSLSMDLDSRVDALMSKTHDELRERLTVVQNQLKRLQLETAKLRHELDTLREAMPLPEGWEAKISPVSGLVEFHDHRHMKASYVRPHPPLPGQKRIEFMQLPSALQRIGQLIGCADQWWQLQAEEERLLCLEDYARTPQAEGASYQCSRHRLEASFIGNAHIVFATLNSAARLRQHMAQTQAFGAVIVDEAAQATEPAVLIPLLLSRSRRCVLAGDDRQLPPTVFSKNAEQHFVARTLFERLRQLGHQAKLLDQQYRMHPAISAFPRSYFYGGALRDAADMEDRRRRRLHNVCPPVLFLDVQMSVSEQDSKGSWRNAEEARICVEVASTLLQSALDAGEEHALDIGIITSYQAQHELLRQELRAARLPPENVCVNTVDGYQGRESEIIILSPVRAPQADGSSRRGVGFWASERRLNVALTRAKSILVVVGHADTLVSAPAWRALVEHMRDTPRCYHWIASRADLGGVWRELALDHPENAATASMFDSLFDAVSPDEPPSDDGCVIVID